MFTELSAHISSTNNELIIENGSLVEYNLHHFKEFAEKLKTSASRCSLRLLAENFTQNEQKCNSEMNPSKAKECRFVQEHLSVLFRVSLFLGIKSEDSGLIHEETPNEECNMEHNMTSGQLIS